jgi:hypothetical protein
MPDSQPAPGASLSDSEICPHLGLAEDIQTCLAYPSHWNLCHRSRPASVPRLGHQRKTCLSSVHTACPVFQREQVSLLPAHLRDRRKAIG